MIDCVGRNAMLVVHATFPIDSEHQEEARERIKTLAEHSRQEDGIIEYQTAIDIDDKICLDSLNNMRTKLHLRPIQKRTTSKTLKQHSQNFSLGNRQSDNLR